MRNSTFFLGWGFAFLAMGVLFPFYIPSNWGLIPFGMSFLVDAPVLFIVSMACWAYESLQRARREDYSETWIEE